MEAREAMTFRVRLKSCVSQEAPQHKVVVRRTFLEVETVAGLVREGLETREPDQRVV